MNESCIAFNQVVSVVPELRCQIFPERFYQGQECEITASQYHSVN
jgi:hypothetical protein